jgi:iron complex outermembrane receptor protein
MKIDDMIQWLNTPFGYYSPFNINRVESYGIEYQLKYFKKFGENTQLRLSANYALTKSKNLDTGYQLMYVPLHKAAANADFEYRFLKIYAQGMFTGLTYTTSNETRKDAIDPYFVMNVGISATVLKEYTFGMRINNITDTVYETVAFYPLPKRNYSFYATLNF